MSAGSTNGLEFSYQRPDFWELTNFGTNVIYLADYRWYDSADQPFEGRKSLPPINLEPGKSVIFVRSSITSPISDETDFRAWWGSNLPVDLSIHFLTDVPGFDADRGEGVWLWDPETNLVDEVRFGPAHMGVTFTYDTNSGAFSEFSQENVDGAFRAAIGGDIGSPGYATKGPVPLHITEQPTSQSVDPGSEVILKVQATGRPGPRYQWYLDGVPAQTAGGNPSAAPRLVCFADCGPAWRSPPGRNDLTLTDIQPGQSGNYSVEIFNGLESLTSVAATITVNTNPTPIQVECPPEQSCFSCNGNGSEVNFVARPGQTAIFTVRNRGFPLPSFQWSRSTDGLNFTDIPGQTNRDLALSNLQDSDVGTYRVRLQNSNGTVTASARLSIEPSPRLEITEVMSQACSALDRDWWELTNTGTEPVNLCGYRWDDDTGSSGIGAGPTITNDVIVQPGASVILMESQTAESFIQWWGASNLPPNIQFITYAANGLGPSGDQIYLWEPNETEAYRPVHNVVFSGAILGKTRWFVSGGGCALEDYGVAIASITNKCGAFQAGGGCEIGSPGWTRWTPPTLTSVRREGLGMVVSWSAQPGSMNRIEFARQLANPLHETIWETLNTFQSSWAASSTTDSTIGVEPQRFYRVVRVAEADCPCP